MSLDLDPTEQQLAAALGRLAAAYVPDAGEPPAPAKRPDHRRWLALAVAASLIALVAGIWAVAGRDTDPAPVTVPPTPAPPPTAPTTAPTPTTSTTSTDTTPPEAAIEVPDDPVAIIDPAIAPSEPTTIGQIDAFLRHLDDYEQQTLRAVRRAPDGSVEAAVVVGLAPDIAGLTGDVTIAGRSTVRSVAEAFDQVLLRVDLDGGTLDVTTSLDTEPEVTAWLEQLLADPAVGEPDVAALAPPEGFEALPPPLTINHVTYADGAGFITIDTTRFAAPVEAATVAAAQTFGADITTTDAITTVVMEGGASYLLWQPSPDVLVTLPGDGDRGRWPGDLILTSMDAAQPIPVFNGFGFGGDGSLDERSLERIVLGETSAGRFVYVEGSDRDGFPCTGWTSERFGGTSGCGATSTTGSVPTAPARRWCGSSWGIGEGAYLYAIAIDEPDATFEFTVDGAPAIPTAVERGQAVDGTPFAAAWIHDPDAPSDPQSLGTVTIDGAAC